MPRKPPADSTLPLLDDPPPHASSDTLAPAGEEQGTPDTFPATLPTDAVASLKGSITLPQHDDGEPVELTAECPGRYASQGLYAEGGQARVLLVRDQHLGREVAWKELHPSLDPLPHEVQSEAPHPHESRFVREARVTGQLEHPNIVPVYELGRTDDGRAYYTMRLIQGRTLAEALEDCSGLPERLALLGHFLDLCHAMAYAHTRGVIHRDIKPQNVMVGSFGETVLLDWGLAKLHDGPDDEPLPGLEPIDVGSSTETRQGALLGTPAYMSPEQARGEVKAIDARSDVWGLGAVLYELLTGEPPFNMPDPYETLAYVARGRVTPVRQRCPDAPPELAAIAAKALAADRDDRYPTAAALAADLSAYLTGGRVRVYAYSSWELLRRFAARNKPALVAAGLVLAVILVSLVLVFSAWQQELAARKAEALARQGEHEQRLEAAFHLSQAHASEALALIEDGEVLSAAIHAAASLDTNPAHPASRHHDPSYADHDAARDLAVDALSHLYQAAFRPVTGLDWQVSLEEAVTDLAYTPGGDGLVMADRTGGVRIQGTGDDTLRFQGCAPGGCVLAVSPTGDRLYTADVEGTLRAWPLDGSTPHWEVEVGLSRLLDIAVSPDGERIVTGSEDGSVRSWSAETGVPALHTLGHESVVWAVDYGPRGERMVSAGMDGSIRLWSARDGTSLGGLASPGDDLQDVAFDPSGERLATAAMSGQVRILDLASGEVLATMVAGDHPVSRVTWSPDGATVAFVSHDRSVQLWDPGTGLRLQRILAHGDGAQAVAFSPDGRWLVTGSSDRSVRRWRVNQGPATTLATAHPVYSLAIHPGGHQAVTVGVDGWVEAWDLATGQLVRSYVGHGEAVNLVSFLPKGEGFLTAGFDGTLRSWTFATGEQSAQLPTPHRGLRALALAPSGEAVLTTSLDGRAALIDLATGQATELPREPSGTWGVAFHPDGRQLVTADGRGRIHFRGAPDAAPTRTLEGHDDWVTGLAFSSDGGRLASSGKDTRVLVWDLEEGTVTHRLEGHSQWVNRVAFSPDGHWLASVADDGLAILWDLDQGEPVLRLHLAGIVTRVSFAPDGSALAVLAGTRVRIFPLDPRLFEVEPASLLPRAQQAAGLELGGFELRATRDTPVADPAPAPSASP